MNSMFKKLCELINERSNSTKELTRADIILRIGEVTEIPTDKTQLKAVVSYTAKTKIASMSTLDGYRNMLVKAGYLTTDGNGNYRVIKEIPNNISISEIRKEAYGYRISPTKG